MHGSVTHTAIHKGLVISLRFKKGPSNHAAVCKARSTKIPLGTQRIHNRGCLRSKKQLRVPPAATGSGQGARMAAPSSTQLALAAVWSSVPIDAPANAVSKSAAAGSSARPATWSPQSLMKMAPVSQLRADAHTMPAHVVTTCRHKRWSAELATAHLVVEQKAERRCQDFKKEAEAPLCCGSGQSTRQQPVGGWPCSQMLAPPAQHLWSGHPEQM